MSMPRKVSVERREPGEGTKRTLLSSSQGHEENSKGDQDKSGQ